MALIRCPECKHEVSSHAAACPKCACPLAGTGVQTIEQTGKSLKLQVLLSSLMIVFGLVGSCCFGVAGTPHSGYAPIGVILAAVGFVWYLVARITIWWRHE